MLSNMERWKPTRDTLDEMLKKRVEEYRTNPRRKLWHGEYSTDWPKQEPMEVSLREAPEEEAAGVGVFLLGLLFSLIDLPDVEESSIDGEGK